MGNLRGDLKCIWKVSKEHLGVWVGSGKGLGMPGGYSWGAQNKTLGFQDMRIPILPAEWVGDHLDVEPLIQKTDEDH